MAEKRIKTASLTVRLEPQIKALAEQAAKADRRSITQLLEVLIIEHAKKAGLEVAQA